MPGLEQWLADPMNWGTIICLGLWLSFVLNWAAGTFDDLMKPIERSQIINPLPMPDRYEQAGKLYAEAMRRAEAGAYPIMAVEPIGPEFEDLGQVTHADVTGLLAAIDGDISKPFVFRESPTPEHGELHEHYAERLNRQWPARPPKDSAGPKAVLE